MADFVFVRNEKGQEKRISATTWKLLGNAQSTGNTRKGWTLMEGKRTSVPPPTKAKEVVATFIPPEIQEAEVKKHEAEQALQAKMISAEPQGKPAAAAVVAEAPAAAAAPVEAPAAADHTSAPAPVVGGDKLTAIDGITAKVESVLNAAGLTTYKQMASTPITTINKALDEAGLGPKKALVPTWKTKAKELATK
jgi:predicted flap endonuclease-1-like 5' DNA nuclease